MIPFGKTITLGDALDALPRVSPPPPTIELERDADDDDDDDDDFGSGPPAADISPDPPGTQPPAAHASDRDDDPDSFAQLAGKIGTQVGVALLAGIHRKRGYEPNELDDDELENLEVQTAKAIRRGIGDGPVPWWAPVVSAWGLAFFSMGANARRLERPAPDQLVPDEPSSSSSPPPPPPPPPGPIRPPASKPAPIQITPTRAA